MTSPKAKNKLAMEIHLCNKKHRENDYHEVVIQSWQVERVNIIFRYVLRWKLAGIPFHFFSFKVMADQRLLCVMTKHRVGCLLNFINRFCNWAVHIHLHMTSVLPWISHFKFGVLLVWKFNELRAFQWNDTFLIFVVINIFKKSFKSIICTILEVPNMKRKDIFYSWLFELTYEEFSNWWIFQLYEISERGTIHQVSAYCQPSH